MVPYFVRSNWWTRCADVVGLCDLGPHMQTTHQFGAMARKATRLFPGLRANVIAYKCHRSTQTRHKTATSA